MIVRCPHCRRKNPVSLRPEGSPHPRCMFCGRDMAFHRKRGRGFSRVLPGS